MPADVKTEAERYAEAKLIIDERTATEVRDLFDRYLQLGSVPKLVAELNGGFSLKLLQLQLQILVSGADAGVSNLVHDLSPQG